jgi:hypothetical protein
MEPEKMKTIYKYDLGYRGIDSSKTIKMPDDSICLDVKLIGNDIYLWVLVDTEKPEIERRFTIVGTGWDLGDMPNHSDYLGTVVTIQKFVWHVYEVPLSLKLEYR